MVRDDPGKHPNTALAGVMRKLITLPNILGKAINLLQPYNDFIKSLLYDLLVNLSIERG